MAVSWRDTVRNDYTWSLGRELNLSYTKDSNNDNVVVTVNIEQGAYTKTLTLRYSGIIKEASIDIANLVRPYFQKLDYDNDKLILQSVLNSLEYTTSHTMKVGVIITDNISTITFSAYFLRNGNFNFEENFGTNNFSIKYPEQESKTFSISEDYKILNYPIYLGSLNSAGGLTQIKITRYELDSTFIDELTYSAPTAIDERIAAIPVGKKNTLLGSPPGIKIVIEFSIWDGSAWSLYSTSDYTFNYITPCDDSRKKTIWFEGRYGGIESIVFANDADGYSKESNDFTLQNGNKIQLNARNRKNGNFISEYVKEAEQDIYTAFFLSEKIQTFIDTDLVSILVTGKTHRIKQVNNIKMVQYNFAHEEVERLKY